MTHRPMASASPPPRGIDVLLRKASLDPDFRRLLLEGREAAAASIGLSLTPSEAAMLRAVPRDHLEAAVAGTRVEPRHRPVFLGTAVAAMVAALAATAPLSGCMTCTGISPEHREELNRKRRELQTQGRPDAERPAATPPTAGTTSPPTPDE